MNIADLPSGANNPNGLTTPHFPTRHQAVIWRNWELVPVDRLALVLGTTSVEVLALAKNLGLRTPAQVCPTWLTNGYCTIIRENWHLLPYEQILQLLDWSVERLDAVLRDEDFLWIKFGRVKPVVEPVRWSPLSTEQVQATHELQTDLNQALTPTRGTTAAPFSFLKTLESAPKKRTSLPPTSALRLAHSYAAIGGDPLFQPGRDIYTDGELARYAATGVNGIWLHGLLNALYPWAAFPELSSGWETRLNNLRSLVTRAATHGIGVYLYLNEPRGLPPATIAARPDLKGSTFPDADLVALCTSQAEVKRFLRDGSAHVFSHVPGLAGVLTITMSEAPTNCLSRAHPTPSCPLCSTRGGGVVVAEVNELIAQGIQSVDPSARVIAWSWGWDPAWELEAIDRLPTTVDVMCVSEWGLATKVGGINGTVIDYSISQVGPSPQTLRLWQHARARGLRTVAKVQLNNSWEMSAIPWLPVPDLVERHLARLREAGVEDLMLGWTLGGYPGGNFALIDSSADAVAIRDYGSAAAPLIRRAWSLFSRAFSELPFSCDTIYFSPLNIGPANALHIEPSRRPATMVVGFPYDDLTTWRGVYPEDVFESQLKKLSAGWRRGMALLDQAAVHVPPAKRSAFNDLYRISHAADCHFRSTWLQVRFIRARDRADSSTKRTLQTILREEQRLACTLAELIRHDSRIGFEAANHYCYTTNSLFEKAVQCAWLLRTINARGVGVSSRTRKSSPVPKLVRKRKS